MHLCGGGAVQNRINVILHYQSVNQSHLERKPSESHVAFEKVEHPDHLGEDEDAMSGLFQPS